MKMKNKDTKFLSVNEMFFQVQIKVYEATMVTKLKKKTVNSQIGEKPVYSQIGEVDSETGEKLFNS